MHRLQWIGRRVWIAVGGLLTVITIGVVAYVAGGPAPGCGRRRGRRAGATASTSAPMIESTTSGADDPVQSADTPAHIAPIPATGDADEYAASVARSCSA